jgi:hypothetical protein
MSGKALLGAFASCLTVVAYLPYLRAILQGRATPHVFSWIVWGTATLLAFAAALQAGGGWGAWVIGLSAVTSFIVAAFGHARRAEVRITRTDVAFFVAALMAVPLWLLARDPLWAVMLLTLIELLGFGPTFRKAWWAPRSESAMFLALLGLRNVLVLGALDRHVPATVLFPAASGLACMGLVAVLLWRRQASLPARL